MQSSHKPPDHSQCPVCRAEVPPASPFCGSCGSKVAQTTAQEILNLNYLLAELSRWEAEGIIKPEQSQTLREAYQLKREELRSQLSATGSQERRPARIRRPACAERARAYRAWDAPGRLCPAAESRGRNPFLSPFH